MIIYSMILIFYISLYKQSRMKQGKHNSQKQRNLLNVLVGDAIKIKQPNKRIDYDNFVFVDNLSNHKVVIGEAKKIYGLQGKTNKLHSQSHSKPQRKTVNEKSRIKLTGNKRISQIEDCWDFMKTTKLFQMQKFKEKLIVKNKENAMADERCAYQEVHKRKKNLREFIKDYVYSLNLEQFRKSTQPIDTNDPTLKKYVINKKIMNLLKNIPQAINQRNFHHIIEQILGSEEKIKDKAVPNSLIEELDSFPEEQRLQDLLFHHCCMKNKQFEHLISPKRQLLSQSFAFKKIKRQPFQYRNSMQQFQFKQLDNNKLNAHKDCKQDDQEEIEFKSRFRKVKMAVENGLIYDLMFWLVCWPNLLYAVDDRGNNLLHIAAKNNQVEAYDILVKKMGIEYLSSTNKSGKTPVLLAKIFSSFDVVNRNKQYESSL